MRLRALQASDKPSIQKILFATDRFTPQEIDVAVELVDDALQITDSDYQFIIAVNENNNVEGYACWGKVAVSDIAWDLYWIAVDPAMQHRSIGTQLLRHVEENIMYHQGKILLIETSSTSHYDSARGFYEKSGFRREAEIHDYYRLGDNRVIYVKRLDQFH